MKRADSGWRSFRDFLQQAAVRYRGSRRHGPAQRRVDHCQHRRVAIGLLRTAGGLPEPYPHASPRRRSIFSISATCISSWRIFSRANSSSENTAPLAQPKKLLVESDAFALVNDELSQNVVDRFVVGTCKFANPELKRVLLMKLSPPPLRSHAATLQLLVPASSS